MVAGIRHCLRPDSGLPESLPLSTKSPYPAYSTHAPPAPSEPVSVHYILRHGARYPSLSGMGQVAHIYNLLRNHVPPTWINPDIIAAENEAMLSRTGHLETTRLAHRIAQRYPDLLSDSQNLKAVRLVTSQLPRTIDTAKAFRHALDPNNYTPPVTVIPRANDTTLSMKYNCPRWIAAHAQLKPEIAHELDVFDAVYPSSLRRISHALGVAPGTLDMADIQVIYTLCGYDATLYGEHRHWCSLFDQQTAALLELRSDISYSRVYGPHGGEINSRISCVLFAEILREVDRALHSPGRAASTFRFAHAETLMFASNHLRLHQALGSTDRPIAGNMTYEDSRRRGFRTSVLAPYSSNLGIEVYHAQPPARPQFRLLLNEQVVRLPGCPEDLCELGHLRTALHSEAACDHDNLCQI
ncbi:PHOsphatase [Coemansia sp. RSA 552]|nr:PHOsphatase [Coemansia sp. RSA 552]